jgi:hypothetical protein
MLANYAVLPKDFAMTAIEIDGEKIDMVEVEGYLEKMPKVSGTREWRRLAVGKRFVVAEDPTEGWDPPAEWGLVAGPGLASPTRVTATQAEIKRLRLHRKVYRPYQGATSVVGAAVLSVPSVIIPKERTYVINPAHHDFSLIRFGHPELFEFDPRLEKRTAAGGL